MQRKKIVTDKGQGDESIKNKREKYDKEKKAGEIPALREISLCLNIILFSIIFPWDSDWHE
jgi:hypothetical protein